MRRRRWSLSSLLLLLDVERSAQKLRGPGHGDGSWVSPQSKLWDTAYQDRFPQWERSMRGYFRISHSGTEWFDMSLATRIAALSSLKSQRWKLFQNNFEVKTHDPHWCWRRKFGSDRVFETLRELVLKYFVLMTRICLWLEVPVWQDCHVSHLLLFRVESLAWWSPSSPAEVTAFSVLSVVLLKWTSVMSTLFPDEVTCSFFLRVLLSSVLIIFVNCPNSWSTTRWLLTEDSWSGFPEQRRSVTCYAVRRRRRRLRKYWITFT